MSYAHTAPGHSWPAGKPWKSEKGADKIDKTMHEYGKGTLHSGSKKGPVVTNHDQAVAIALSQARKAGK